MIQTQCLMERTGVPVPRQSILQVFDPLIGAYDRGHLPAVVQSLASRHSPERGTSCLMISLDNPGQIEEGHGFEGVAAAIRELAEKARAAAGTDSVLVRYKHNVLCLFLLEARFSAALVVADQIRRQMAIARIPVRGNTLMAIVSIGVSTANSASEIESFALLDYAEVALAKASPRGNEVAAAPVAIAA